MPDNPFLVADIGGTATRLALSEGATLLPHSITSYENDGVADFDALLKRFLRKHPIQPCAIALAGAGPVSQGQIRLTNRNWTISAAQIARLTNCANIALLNDLQAMGHALAVAEVAGTPLTQPRLVLAIGTGLNIAAAHPTANGAMVPAAESGYSTLPFTTPEDADVLSRLPVPAVESALSGPNLTRLHHLLTGETRSPHDITSGGADTSQTLDLVLRVLGAHMGSLALTHLPYGGLFLAGSVGRALFQHLDHPGFRHHYTMRGPYTDLINKIPLKVIDSDVAPLHGLAQHLVSRVGVAASEQPREA